MANIIAYNPEPDSTVKAQGVPMSVQASNVCVLVVEDHEDTREMLKTMLEMRGLSVVEAANGVMAIALAEKTKPDMILMDSDLPLLDGYEATRRIREILSTREVPIVFISGHAQPAAQARAFAAGCTDYLIKPFAHSEMDNVLARHLSPGDLVKPARAGQKTLTKTV